MSETGREKEREELPAHPFLGVVRDTVSHSLFGKDSEEDAKGSSLFKAVGKIAKHAVFGSDESSSSSESKESKTEKATDASKKSDQLVDSSSRQSARSVDEKYELKLKQHRPQEREAIAQESHRDDSSFTSLHEKYKPTESSKNEYPIEELIMKKHHASPKKQAKQEKPHVDDESKSASPKKNKEEKEQEEEEEEKKEEKEETKQPKKSATLPSVSMKAAMKYREKTGGFMTEDKRIEQKVETMENCLYDIASDMEKMGIWPHSGQPLHLPPCGAEVSEEYSANPNEIRRGDECGILPQDVDVKVELNAPFIPANAYENSEKKSSTHAGETIGEFPNWEGGEQASVHRREISERFQQAAEHNQRSTQFDSQWPEKSQEISQPKEQDYSWKKEEQQPKKPEKSVRISEETKSFATNNNNFNTNYKAAHDGYLFELRTSNRDNDDENNNNNARKIQRENELRRFYEESLKRDEEDGKRALEEFNRNVQEKNVQEKAATTIERAYRHHHEYQQQRHHNDTAMRTMTEKEQREEEGAKQVQIRAPLQEEELEQLVSDCFKEYLENAAATTIQRVFRGHVDRQHYHIDREQKLKIHREIKQEDEKQNRLAQDIEREIQAAIKIQAAIRGYLARMKHSGGQPHEGARDWNTDQQQEFTEISIEEGQEESNIESDKLLNKESEETYLNENSPLLQAEDFETFSSEYGTVQERLQYNNDNNKYYYERNEEYSLTEEEEPCIMIPFKEEEKNNIIDNIQQQQQQQQNIKKKPAVVAGGRRLHQAEHPYYVPKTLKKHDQQQQEFITSASTNNKESDQKAFNDENKQIMKEDQQLKSTHKKSDRLRKSAGYDEESKVFPSTYHPHEKAGNAHKRSNEYTKSH